MRSSQSFLRPMIFFRTYDIDDGGNISYIRNHSQDGAKQMRLTTETTLGHMIFKTSVEAETFISEMADLADAGETFEVRPFQGNRFHVARFYNGNFEAYC